jgi:hypothetical protein
VTWLLVTFAAAGLWTTLWALASRVAFGESRWMRHAAIVFVAYAALTIADTLLEIVNGALGLHLSPAVLTIGAIGVAVSAALASHLMNASPMRPRVALMIGVAIPAIIIAAVGWVQVRAQNRDPSYMPDRDRLLPPALLVRRGVPPGALAAALVDLKARADGKRVFAEREDPSPADPDPD